MSDRIAADGVEVGTAGAVGVKMWSEAPDGALESGLRGEFTYVVTWWLLRRLRLFQRIWRRWRE
jgi:hypothetical protein